MFSKPVLRAIFLRKKEVDREYFILSKIMQAYSMEAYTPVVENLILDSEYISPAIERDHVVLDIYEKDIWLSNVGLYMFADILKGFINEDMYENFLDCADSLENMRRISNQSLQLYQEKSIAGLLHIVVEHYQKYRKEFPEETPMIYMWCVLELLSRTRLPKIYYFIKELPTRISFKSSTRYLKKRLNRLFPVEGSD